MKCQKIDKSESSLFLFFIFFLDSQQEIYKNRYFKEQVRWVTLITPSRTEGGGAMGTKVATIHNDRSTQYPRTR